MAFIIHCTVEFWLGFFPHFRLHYWLHSHRVSCRAEREMYFSVTQNLLLLDKAAVLKGRKNEAFSAASKMPFPKRRFFSLDYRFITLGYSFFLPNWDHWNCRVKTSSCIMTLSGVVAYRCFSVEQSHGQSLLCWSTEVFVKCWGRLVA